MLKLIYLSLVCILVTSCSLDFSAPLAGPLLLNAQIRPKVANEVIVAITNANVERHLRSKFLDISKEFYSSLYSVEGYVGGSLRLEPFGNQVWTLTIWKDKDALDRFALEQPHMASIFSNSEGIIKSRSTSFAMKSKLVPEVWEKAIATLEKIPEQKNPDYF
ncbi:MAG: hypothetical protein AB8G05_25805 [Oligoflexales bacterium]